MVNTDYSKFSSHMYSIVDIYLSKRLYAYKYLKIRKNLKRKS